MITLQLVWLPATEFVCTSRSLPLPFSHSVDKRKLAHTSFRAYHFVYLLYLKFKIFSSFILGMCEKSCTWMLGLKIAENGWKKASCDGRGRHKHITSTRQWWWRARNRCHQHCHHNTHTHTDMPLATSIQTAVIFYIYLYYINIF